MKIYTQEQMLDVLLAFEQALNPEEFESSKELIPEDFGDAPICKAQELGLENEFNEAVEKYKKGAEGYVAPTPLGEPVYSYIPWPDSQEYMAKEWFQEEAIFDVENGGHFIPVNRLDDCGYDEEE